MNDSFDLTTYVAKSIFAEPPPEAHHDLIACIGENGGPYTFGEYAIGYFDAANRMDRSLRSDPSLVDVTALPTLFLYRHGIELAIKHLICLLSPYHANGEVCPRLDHRILENWQQLQPMLEAHNQHHQKNGLVGRALTSVRILVEDIDAMDPQSYVFRYVTGKKGQVYLAGRSRIDMDIALTILTELKNWFENLINEIPDELSGD